MADGNPQDRDAWLVFVRELAGASKDGRKLSLWRCVCGKEKAIPHGRVKGGYIKSCGCKVVENAARAKTTHGLRSSAEYASWHAMKDRCLNPESKDYPNWGGRGIKINKLWEQSFQAFYDYVGAKPGPDYSIDRIDVNGDYEPGNVRWASFADQNNNRRDTVIISTPAGVMPISRWAERIGITRGAAHQRLKRSKLEGCSRVSN